ncbi:MAG: hypothetical protein AAF696_17475 [Bacteroidota bacterium]
MYILRLIFIVLLSFNLPFLSAQDSQIPVNKIIPDTPEDLDKNVLLIPRFDFMDVEDGAVGKRRQFIVHNNRKAKESNTTLNKTIMKAYPYEYKLISMSEIGYYRNEGYKYFLDMALMPKQMKQPKPEALIPAYEKWRTANKMYSNRNTMWHHYFYIRDIQQDDAYISQNFKGGPEVYKGIARTLKQFKKDIEAEE